SCQAQGLFSDLKRYPITLNKHASGRNWRNEPFRATFTFTHPYFGWFLSNWLIRENTNPYLSLTLHITGNGNPCRFYLTACDPLGLQGLDAEGTEGQFMTSLCIPFHPSLLLPSEFYFFWL